MMALGMAASLSACSLESSTPQISGTQNEENSSLSMEEAPQLNYDIPDMEPGIIVDRNGYSTQEVKYAWIVGENIPEEYNIHDANTNEIVYTGKTVKNKYDEESKQYIAEFTFAELQKEGEYYIAAENLGESCRFVVGETHYKDVFEELLEAECKKCRDGEADAWECYMMVYTYERYKDVISTDSEKYDVMSAVKEWIAESNFDKSAGSEAYLQTALLAKFAYNYTQTDRQLATECLQKAAAIYKRTIFTEECTNEKFIALTELYRSSADASYSKEILDMESYLEKLDRPHDSRYILYGSMAYMMTRGYVSRDLCDSLMNALLYECEDNNKDKILLHPTKGDADRASELLVYAQQFEVLNYILDGYEYNEKIMSIIHYLSGRNSQGVICELNEEFPSDGLVIYAWLALLEKNGKLDPNAPVVWQYSW